MMARRRFGAAMPVMLGGAARMALAARARQADVHAVPPPERALNLRIRAL